MHRPTTRGRHSESNLSPEFLTTETCGPKTTVGAKRSSEHANQVGARRAVCLRLRPGEEVIPPLSDALVRKHLHQLSDSSICRAEEANKQPRRCGVTAAPAAAGTRPSSPPRICRRLFVSDAPPADDLPPATPPLLFIVAALPTTRSRTCGAGNQSAAALSSVITPALRFCPSAPPPMLNFTFFIS